MASSSERDAARAPGRLPPPDDVAAFYALVEKTVTAAALCRHTRSAEFYERAAKHAERLYGENSLLVAQLRVGEVAALIRLTEEASDHSEKVTLFERAWASLFLMHNLLLRRLEANTLLPGTIKEEETIFEMRVIEFRAKKKKMSFEQIPEAVVRSVAETVGCNTLMDAVFQTLNMMMVLQNTTLQREIAQSFVLMALDAIPRTASIDIELPHEKVFVALIELRMNTRNFEPAFCAAVLHKWRSSAVADVLRARGSLQTGVAVYQQFIDEFEERRRADVEKIGLRECAWPSCDKVERTVREFKQCSGCRSVWYCSPEHHTLHWGAQKGLPKAGQEPTGGAGCRRRGVGCRKHRLMMKGAN